MIYPIAKTKEEWSKWYNAQGYGVEATYGYHEGCDLNLRTGGDSDLGQPLYAIADGEITSVCETHSTKNFGRHLHLKISGSWGVRWAHYCHCQQILVKEGQKVKEGDRIALLGKSGTEYAHLHFAIKNKPTGIEGIAKTKEQLKSWDDPIVFIEKYFGKSEEKPVTDTDKYRLLYETMQLQYGELKIQLETSVKEIKKLRELTSGAESDKSKILDLEKSIEVLQKEVSDKQLAINELCKVNEALLEETKLLNALKNAVSSLFRR